MKFIKLHDSKNRIIYVNAERIDLIDYFDGMTVIFCGGSETEIRVKECAGEIIKIIEGGDKGEIN